MAGKRADLAAALRRAFAGDEQAARALVLAWGPILAGVAGHCLTRTARSQVDPEDVVQEVFCSFFSHPLPEPLLDKPGDVLKLLERAAHNRAANANRRTLCAKRDGERVQPLESLTPAEAGTLVSQEAGPAEAAAAADEWAHMLDAQPPVQQVLLVLLRDGYTHPEAAEPLGVCPKTVQRAVADARRSQAVP